ncbi:CDP-paratose 2-epimerase [Rubripirellula tenax]|uniref:CDP-paratose 2-epimerase n=1 Tax=Rubripirellula tenax TaxID=2528015 RepID=A0A5C6F6C8_9BACT|nr:NAD-dependent epimerase/dehydratase family protein [Rubripirellula tenax]TWU56918.1 CDP-paratose 2-epimerase [Rubripirellula tenax]
MNVLITGACGFVGSSIARYLLEANESIEVHGIDNLIRRGSETNRDDLIRRSVRIRHADIRIPSDLAAIGDVDWVIDAAAMPSVLAGVDGTVSATQLVQHNLVGTLNLIEFCRERNAGLVLLSTSRVYSIDELNRIPLKVVSDRFAIDGDGPGVTGAGIDESFSTTAPISLYGATKLASETMAIEYGLTYDFPVRINRCGVIGGAGQFGRADQGIFAFWIHSHLRKKPIRYIGFGGSGHQVRDCLHPRDLARLVNDQIHFSGTKKPGIVHVSGGIESSASLRELTRWCDDRFGLHPVIAGDESRTFDVPWVVLDSSLAKDAWSWKPDYAIEDIFEEIAQHAEANPTWLELSL